MSDYLLLILQGILDRCNGMDKRSVEDRHCDVLCPDQQTDLRAPQNDPLRALGDQLLDDLDVLGLRLGINYPHDQLVVDHFVHDLTPLRGLEVERNALLKDPADRSVFEQLLARADVASTRARSASFA